MAVTKRKRFEVFKRDGFTCQYCGGKPPGIVLECDHLDPVSKGGSDDIDNLITSCFDCNRGKSNHEIEVAPASVAMKAEMLKEQRAQLKAYRVLKAKIQAENETEISDAADYIDETLHDFYRKQLSDSFRKVSLKTFVTRGMSADELIYAWDISKEKFRIIHPEQDVKPELDVLIRYFCGVCWKRIKEDHQ